MCWFYAWLSKPLFCTKFWINLRLFAKVSLGNRVLNESGKFTIYCFTLLILTYLFNGTLFWGTFFKWHQEGRLLGSNSLRNYHTLKILLYASTAKLTTHFLPTVLFLHDLLGSHWCCRVRNIKAIDDMSVPFSKNRISFKPLITTMPSKRQAP